VERAPPGGLAGEGVGLQEVGTPGEVRGQGAAGKSPGRDWTGRANK
jgi:hypothetical protein